MADDENVPAPRRIEPIYRPAGEQGEIILYAGDLDVRAGDQERKLTGQIELRLFPDSDLRIRFAGPQDQLLPVSFLSGTERTASVPDGSSLAPPHRPVLPAGPEEDRWQEDQIKPLRLEAGDLASAERLIIHFTRAIEPRFRTQPLSDGQGQISFELPGWNLVLAPIDEPGGNDSDFGGVIEAVPTTSAPEPAEIEKLTYRLFILLSLIASREVGIGPACGLDRDGGVVWAEWGPPRLRPGRMGAGWCPRHLIPTTLPAIAEGYSELAVDAALEAVVQRAVNHLVFADSPEVLDVRIPIACAGLELLSWAVLRGHEWVGQDTFQLMKAAPGVRLLLRWAEIPAEIPDHFHALARRKASFGSVDWGGPEVLFNVRNLLIHPPKKLDDPDWPDTEEMVEAWQLATWYLQLAILRIFGYRGDYGSRLRLPRSEMAVEPVPWAVNTSE